MLTAHQMIIRPVDLNDRHRLRHVIQYGAYIHQHLDWNEPKDWIGYQPFIAAEWDHQFKAVLACPPDPLNIAWIRLFAVSAELNARDAWSVLWSALFKQEKWIDMIVAAIPLNPWFQEFLKGSQFEAINNVVLLEWNHNPSLIVPKPSPIRIREMTFEDLPAVHQVDVQAFDPIWQISKRSLEGAWTKSAISTVAETSSGISGYQISTAASRGAHLARLAVLPDRQGGGIGSGLVQHLLTQLHLWGSQRVTVNTQTDNIASLGLYEKLGFRRTEEVYPVYQRTIKASGPDSYHS
jgi:ribosomal-protein-alanine N-acetyltransferase